ncbi:fibronectin type-III domain-containing protein 3a-like [Sinocyclocheilus rhinocerous]|uniref:fibronectin type-III domain-containing protein 3a-like n=1 Tax=Sinocyclocheilus rhinocerous TaxID=307959 RepID=UPI0007BAB7BC|nr:PREDICTED: fibronectin type-III domain-containing protein 3a-like [Sinocyclocheilus rhinocerous]
MADHTSPLESGQLLSPDIPMLTSPPPPPHPPNIVNGDGPQQVILVQVNPGEAFTIQRDDGQFQCITGPAQVPMMSPNGSVPQIYVPPGYVQQIIEENGVRRVLVLPQTEFHPGGHSPLHHPPPPPPHAHLQAFIPHPHIMHPPPHLYSGMAGGTGDMNPQYISQYHPAHTTIYSEQDTHPPHGRAAFAHRDERASKTYERLQKKLKERQGVGGGGGGVLALSKDSPPPSPQKSRGTLPSGGDLQNGLGGKGAEEQAQLSTAVTTLGKSPGRGKETESGELDEEAKALQERLNSICKPVVTDIQAKGASLSWVAPSRTEGDDEPKEGEEGPAEPSFTYEVSVSYSGKDGKYKSAYSGVELSATLQDLRPATDYHVTDIQARGASLSWVAPSRTEGDDEPKEGEEGPAEPSFTYEVSVSYSGKDGKYKSAYSGVELSATLQDLRPATDYHVRVQAMCNCLQGIPSEPVSFTTLSCEPDKPSPPRKASGTKSSLVLQWKAPCDNGSKIQNYILQWDEGKGKDAFEQCYYGPQKQYRLTKLSTASRYSFRLAAKNDMGVSEFSEGVHIMTSCSVPAPPLSPELIQSGVTWLCVRWQRPAGSPKEDEISYVLEMEEEGSGYGFQASYDGDELSHTARNLHRSTTYRFRVVAYNAEGKSNPSGVSEFTTAPDRPGCPCRLAVKGKPHPTSFRLTWEPPKDSGGSDVTKYVAELSEGLSGSSWNQVYSGSAMECVCDGLSPGCSYQARVHCFSAGGESPLMEPLQVQTPPVPPGPCQPPRVVGKPKSREVQLRWAPPLVDGGSAVSSYNVEMFTPQMDEGREVYQGSELDCTVGSLLPGRTYGFRLRAANKAGFCLGLRWEAPCDHGSEITSYLIDLGERQPILTGPVTKYIIQNLQPDTTYRIRIQALNSLGAGPCSHTFKLKTKPLPPLPPRLECTASSHQTLRLKWGEGPAKAQLTDSLQYHLQMEDKSGRFISLYKGPCHTHKVQRLNESTSYTFCIQAFNEAGEGPFSTVYTFTTPRSPPAPLKAPRVERVDELCEVSWETLPPMKGDPAIYCLQSMQGNSEFKQIYKGSATSYQLPNLSSSTEYRFRVCAIRQCQDAPEIIGPYSSTVILLPPRVDSPGVSGTTGSKAAEAQKPKRSMTDEQFSFLIIALLAVTSILIAVAIQYFVIE